MARLSASARKKIPASKFGVPSKAKTGKAKAKSGNYPMPDKAHARSALSLLHNAPKSQQAAIRAKANRVLGKTSKGGKGKGR